MSNRRTFLKQSLATVTALGAPGAVLSLDDGVIGGRPSPFRYVIYDPDINASTEFAKASEQLGARLIAARIGELGDLWYTKLRDDLREKPGMIAGLTDPVAAMLFRTLSHDVWHYTMLQSEHIIRDGVVRHCFESFGKELCSEDLSTVNSASWPAALAQDLHLAAWQTLDPQPRTRVPVQPADAVRLESWVIGPMHKKKPA